MTAAPILVTGGRGQLGRALSITESTTGIITLDRAQLDITKAQSIEAALDHFRPSVIINAAAYTDVDRAETDEEAADAINHLGAAELARQCARRGIDLVHVSTDYVFDGTPTGGGAMAGPEHAAGYEPDDQVCPATAYGRTKHAGEFAVQRAHPAAIIARTAWVYTGPGRERLGIAGSDFVHTMMRLETQRDTLNVVDDQWGSPTYAGALASRLATLAAATSEDRIDSRGRIVHVAGAGRTTWCGLAREVFRHLGADPARIEPCTTDDVPRPARRPGFSVLSPQSWIALGLPEPQPWARELEIAFSE